MISADCPIGVGSFAHRTLDTGGTSCLMLIVAKRAGNAFIILEMTAQRTNNCKKNDHVITLLESNQFRHLHTNVWVYIYIMLVDLPQASSS